MKGRKAGNVNGEEFIIADYLFRGDQTKTNKEDNGEKQQEQPLPALKSFKQSAKPQPYELLECVAHC